jgi:hypothetical protein
VLKESGEESALVATETVENKNQSDVQSSDEDI